MDQQYISRKLVEFEPVIIHKGRQVKAVLITPDRFQRRFLVYQAGRKTTTIV